LTLSPVVQSRYISQLGTDGLDESSSGLENYLTSARSRGVCSKV
jgi:hypothetical protein